jgi:chromate transporter
LSGFLDAVNACAVGIMIAVTFQLGYDIAGQWQSMVLMALSVFAVLRFPKLSAFWIIIGGGLLGYLLLLF